MPLPLDDWFLAPGVVYLVGTRDAENRPTASRAAGMRLSSDGRTTFVYVCVPEGLTTLDNISNNGLVAVACSRVTDYRALQMKGSGARIVSRGDEAAVAAKYMAENAPIMLAMGMPPIVLQRLVSPEVVAVAFTLESAWEVTPGPNAGREIPL